MPRVRAARKQRKQDLKRTRAFVEDYFGRGTAYAKITTNPKTYVRAAEKRTTESEKKLFKRVPKVYGFTVEQGKRSLILLNDTRANTMAHEFAHAALNRIKKKLGIKTNIHAEETIAYCLMLEWARKNDPKDFERVKRKRLRLTIRSIFGPSHSQTHAIAALNAIKIQEKFTEAERFSLIQDLITKQFPSAFDSSEWLREVIKTQKK
jgi:hypothetical protein